MGLFNFVVGGDINNGVDEWKNTPNSVLIDVRTVEEYKNGHIKGSINLPLDYIDTIVNIVPEKNKDIFLYCLSGARSGRALSIIKSLGYKSVKNIGGINNYKGKLEI